MAEEPRGYIVAWNLSDNTLEVWDTEKSLYRTRNELADFLKIPRHKIRAHCIYSGGDYGSKGQAKYKALTAMAAKKSGRPVKYVGSRFEACQDEGPKYKTEWWGKLGLEKDGTITAKEIVAYSNIGAYGNATPPEMAPVVIQSYEGPFKFQHTGYYTISLKGRILPNYPKAVINLITISNLSYIKMREDSEWETSQAGRHC